MTMNKYEKYKSDLDTIFQEYINEVNVSIVKYEVLTNKYPSEILSEIRQVVTYLGRFCVEDEEGKIENILNTMKFYMVRGKLYCCKYMCQAISDKYDDFFKIYNGVDFSAVNNGTFKEEIVEQLEQAEKMLIRAQNEEDALVPLKNDDYVTEDELSLITSVYEIYQNAFLGYEKVQKLLEEAECTVLSLPKTYKGNEEQQQRDAEFTKKGVWLTIFGIAIGICLAIFL